MNLRSLNLLVAVVETLMLLWFLLCLILGGGSALLAVFVGDPVKNALTFACAGAGAAAAGLAIGFAVRRRLLRTRVRVQRGFEVLPPTAPRA